MELTVVAQGDQRFLEGPRGEPLLAEGEAVRGLIEASMGERVGAILLYAENLPPRFWDLSSLEAGTILQKLRLYQIRLAVVRLPDSPPLTPHFAQLMREEQRDRHFRLFEERAAAAQWLLDD